ncbi:hypothetical protein LOD99_6970 [Oopsacas minuta]|uniref:Rab-GAP TBC domain-containing protein n=1 Tax=Oopsacas minuta TaxID=111878 RepID=A0AAV7JJD8_9METZ|nr:hypothetical protein LOD99_6970 [Oopsacas minuta]
MKIFNFKSKDRHNSLSVSNSDVASPDIKTVNSKQMIKSISAFETSLREKTSHWSKSISEHYLHIQQKFKEKHSNKPISSSQLASFKSRLELGIHTFHSGIISSDRESIWPYLLGVYPLNISPSDKVKLAFKLDSEYTAEKHRWQSNPLKSKSILGLIYKDVDRTDRYTPYFSVSNDHPHFIKLFNVSATYIATDVPDYSLYVQGFTDIVSIFVVIFESESLAYACLKEFMVDQLSILDPKGDAFSARCALLGSLIEILDPAFFRFLEANDASNMLFTYRWFLLNLKREFTFDQSIRVFETVIITRLLAAKPVSIFFPNFIPETKECSIESQIQSMQFPEHSNSPPGNEAHLSEAYKDIFTLFLSYQLLAMYRREFIKKRLTMPEMCEFFSEASGTHNFEVILKLGKNLFSQYICENLSFEADKENDYVYI